MARGTPMMISFPQFSGATRKLILLHLAVFFGLAILGWVAAPTAALLLGHIYLVPLAFMRGELWQLITYAFVPQGLVGMLFAMLTLWFFGSWFEGEYSSRKLIEIYLISAVGAALLTSAISFTHVLALRPDLATGGPWAPLMALLVAFAMVMGNTEMMLFFFLRMKARYVVAIYLLISVVVLLKGGDRLSALAELCGALCGWMYMRFAPRRGLTVGASEKYFSLRNEYYRWKRRRAARKFEVYMRKQNREVHFDKDGRYVEPEDEPRDPNDRKWMN